MLIVLIILAVVVVIGLAVAVSSMNKRPQNGDGGDGGGGAYAGGDGGCPVRTARISAMTRVVMMPAVIPVGIAVAGTAVEAGMAEVGIEKCTLQYRQ